jgi:hypothetical protein
VIEAIVQVLSQSEHPMKWVDIRAAVEQHLGGPVAKSSFKDALASGGNGHGRFVRVSRGRYRLKSDSLGDDHGESSALGL